MAANGMLLDQTGKGNQIQAVWGCQNGAEKSMYRAFDFAHWAASPRMRCGYLPIPVSSLLPPFLCCCFFF
jgi:hypothetical protein